MQKRFFEAKKCFTTSVAIKYCDISDDRNSCIEIALVHRIFENIPRLKPVPIRYDQCQNVLKKLFLESVVVKVCTKANIGRKKEHQKTRFSAQ